MELQHITIDQIIKYGLPIVAILISIFNLLTTHRNAKRGIRVQKLEEIQELLYFLYVYYPKLLEINQFQKILASGDNPNRLIYNSKRYEDKVEQFKNELGSKSLEESMVRLLILTNTYLPKSELKLDIVSLVEMYSLVYDFAIYDITNIEKDFDEFPNLQQLDNFFGEIEDGILHQMSLGYKSVKGGELEAHRKKFKKKLFI